MNGAELIGVLALQGCIAPHLKHLHALGYATREVKKPEHLVGLTRIVLPGGESTTMLKLLAQTELEAPLTEFVKTHPTWGICAGSILLAQKVSHPEQRSLNAIKIHAIRNFYGSQRESFSTTLEIAPSQTSMVVDFIRAPKLEPLAPSVQVLSKHGGDSVLMQEGHVLVSSFHSELREDSSLHRYFCSIQAQ